MRTAREIQDKLKKLHQRGLAAGLLVPRYLQVQAWIQFAMEYLAASTELSKLFHVSRPWMQLSGHAIECAIKAYLCAVRSNVSREHDIVKLIDVAVAAGLSISARNLAMIVHVNHQYSSDLRTTTRYKARYPSERIEQSGGSLPDQASLVQIVESICQQATRVNEDSNSPLLKRRLE